MSFAGLIRAILVAGPQHKTQVFETCLTSIPPENAIALFRHHYSDKNVPLYTQIAKGRWFKFDKAMWVMKNEGQLDVDPQGIISLTERGHKLANKKKEKHEILVLKICTHGHELRPENVRYKKNGHGKSMPVCRECARIYTLKYWNKKHKAIDQPIS